MSEEQTETAESSTAPIETASSTDEELQVPQVETPEPETEQLVLKRKTAERFDKLTSTVKAQQQTIDQLRDSQNRELDYQDPGAPKEADFDTEEEYWTAKGAHEATKTVIGVINQGQVKDRQAQQAATLNQQVQAHTARVQSFLTDHPDFQQVIGASLFNPVDAQGNLTAAGQVTIDQANSAAMEYHLAKNPETALALNQATPAQAGAIRVGSLLISRVPQAVRPTAKRSRARTERMQARYHAVDEKRRAAKALKQAQCQVDCRLGCGHADRQRRRRARWALLRHPHEKSVP